MKKYKYMFWPNGEAATISVRTETKKEAEALVRCMIPERFLDDGLVLIDEEPCHE
jgi:hypothetical protein